MACVDRDNTHWGRIGVRLTGSIHWARHDHLELADLTPNSQSLASTVSKYNPPPPNSPTSPITGDQRKWASKMRETKRQKSKSSDGMEVRDMSEQFLHIWGPKERERQRT